MQQQVAKPWFAEYQMDCKDGQDCLLVENSDKGTVKVSISEDWPVD